MENFFRAEDILSALHYIKQTDRKPARKTVYVYPILKYITFVYCDKKLLHVHNKSCDQEKCTKARKLTHLLGNAFLPLSQIVLRIHP